MIPYLSLTTFSLGPLTIHVWGIFVALGFALGGYVAARFAKQQGDSPEIIWDIVVWMVVAGMIGGRLGHVFLYDPSYYLAHPIEIFEIWKGGLSVYGGFILCAVVGVWRLRHHHVNVSKYVDTLLFGLPFGLWIGRIGCFLIHDHPGTATDFFLGIQFPDGVIRHDLGLYLSINAFVLSIIMLFLSQKRRPVGTYLAAFALWYGFTRFFLDFLRVVDVRYFGLTPAQYFSIVLCIGGIISIMWIRKQQKMLETDKLKHE